jgi:hypothetical protein
MKIIRFLACWACVLLVIPGASFAGSFKRSKNFFLGVSYVNNSVGGGYDGSSVFLSGGGVVLLVPKLEQGSGFGLTCGSLGTKLPHQTGYLGWEAGFNRSAHHWTFEDGEEDESAHAELGASLRLQLLADLPVQPFLLLGMSIGLLEFKSAALDTFTDEVGGASYSAIGFNLGGGLCVYLAEDMALVGEWAFQPGFSPKGFAFDRDYELDPSLSFVKNSLRVGTEFYF